MNSARHYPIVQLPPGVEPARGQGAARYLIVRLQADGKIEIQGSREEVELFLQKCAGAGFVIPLDSLSWCG